MRFKILSLCLPVYVVCACSSLAAILHVPTEYSTIQAALDAAVSSDTVLIADGTYQGSGNRGLDYQGKSVTVKSVNGPQTCIIDCEQLDRGVYFHSGEAATARLEGLSVINGYSGGAEGCGGAIECDAASPTIVNCTFSDNYATQGSGIRCTRSSSAVILNCTFSDNLGTDGGGIHCSENSSPTVHGCNFSNNNCTNGGGIYCVQESSPLITSCRFDNCGATNGGAIATENDCSPSIINCLITNCTATNGGALYFSDSAALIVSCTLAGNSGTIAGGLFSMDSLPVVTNSILWNIAREEIDGSCQVTYSDVKGGWSGVGNLNVDPLFVSGSLGGYYLGQTATGHGANSPCVDAGAGAASAACFTTPEGQLCLSDLTTRTDGAGDMGVVDLGFHYPTDVPVRVSILMPADYYAPGDECWCQARVENLTAANITGKPLFVILDVFGSYFFAPSFGAYDSYERAFPPGETLISVLESFMWPEGAGSADNIMWYGALTNAEVTQLYGQMGTWSFGWGS